MSPTSRRAPDWLILAIACVGQFMVVLDVSVVNVALPAIRSDLHYSPTGLQWVVNAYVLTFAGFLLLGGRIADLFGRRRVFILGVAVFSLASLAGGLSTSSGMLTAARAVQGLGGAVLAPVTLTVIVTTFTEGRVRTRALGTWSAVAGGGGAAGVLLGGVLTTYLSWRWVLFINVPIGVLLGLTATRYLSEGPGRRAAPEHLDLAGAVTVTAGLTALVYTIVGTDTHPWTSPQTLAGLAAAVVLLTAFLVIESHFASAPLMPLRLFRSRSLSAANASMLLFGAALFSFWYFLSLYLQTVLGYDALRAGLAFLPLALSIVVGARFTAVLVPKLGPRTVLLFSLPVSAAGFWRLSGVAVNSSYLTAVIGPGLLISLGLGLCLTPLAAAATSGVANAEAGLASGVVTTSRQVGGSIGLAVLATLATDRTMSLLGRHTAPPAALTAGYHQAFLVSAVLVLGATACAAIIPRARRALPAPSVSVTTAATESPAEI